MVNNYLEKDPVTVPDVNSIFLPFLSCLHIVHLERWLNVYFFINEGISIRDAWSIIYLLP